MRRSERGFTLIELLVAMSLLALVVMLVVGGSGFLGKVRGRVADSSGALETATMVRGLLLDRLGGAVHGGRTEDGDYVVRFEGDVRQLRFVSPRPDFEPGFPLLAFELAIVPGDEAERLVLKVAETGYGESDFAALREAEPRDLATLPPGASFAYLGRDDADSPLRWDERWRHEDRLPQAVGLGLDASPGLLVPLVVPIAVDEPALCGSALVLEAAGCGEP